MRVENPFTRDYWLGEVDARPLALFRILFGSVVLFDLLYRLPDVGFFFSDDGATPRHALPSLWGSWSLFRLVGSPGAVLFLYWLGILAVLAMTLGFRTRLASAATFAFIASLHFRNPAIAIGPDRIMAVLSFWLMLADAGGAWSLDRVRGRSLGPTIPAAGFRFLQWQVALIYFFAGLAKLHVWKSGLALYHFLQIRDCARPLGLLLARWPTVCIALNWLVLATEIGVPLLLVPLTPLWGKPIRVVGIVGGLGLFLGIFLTLRVGPFPQVMASGLALFLLPEWLDRVGPVDRNRAAPAAPRTRPPLLVLGLGGLQLGLVLWSLLSFHLGWPEGGPIGEELRQLDLNQAWTMFAKPAHPSWVWWTGVGVLANDERTSVLEELAPGMVSIQPRPDWQNFRRHLMELPSRRERELFGRYVCRLFDRDAPVSLRELELTLHALPTHDPGEPVAAERIERVYHLSCGAPMLGAPAAIE